MGQKEEKPAKSAFYWFIKGITEASVDISEDLPIIVRPVVRLLYVFIVFLFVVLATPLLIFWHFFPKSKTGDAYTRVKMELDTTWYEQSPEAALDQLRDLRNKLKEHETKLHEKGVQVEPFGKFKWGEYYNIVDLLYHWEIRLGHYQDAHDLCDEILEPFLKEDRKSNFVPEEWFVRKAKTIRALQGPLAAQEFLMPYVDHDKEESHLRDYFLELREHNS